MPKVALQHYGLHYRTYGQKGRPILLFLHGFMGSSEDFEAAIDDLATDFYCVAVDLPGQAQTEVLYPDQGYTMAAITAGLLEFLTILQLSPCHVVGYSMGGRLALYLACQFPQQVSSILMVSASPGLATEFERLQRAKQDHQLALELESGCWSEFLQRWYAQPLFAPLRYHPDFESLLLKRQNNNPFALAQMLRGMGAGVQPSLWDALPDLTLPIHLIVGELDTKFCTINRAMIEQCPAAQLTVVPNCGHAVHLEAPQIFAAILQHDQSLQEPGEKET